MAQACSRASKAFKLALHLQVHLQQGLWLERNSEPVDYEKSTYFDVFGDHRVRNLAWEVEVIGRVSDV